MTVNNRFLAGKQWCSLWMLPILSQPILAPKYNVHQRSKEHDMVSVSVSALSSSIATFRLKDWRGLMDPNKLVDSPHTDDKT